jgi:hypothetical protein
MLNVIYAECRNNPFMLSVVLLNIFMLNVIMLNVVLLNVVAPSKYICDVIYANIRVI